MANAFWACDPGGLPGLAEHDCKRDNEQTGQQQSREDDSADYKFHRAGEQPADSLKHRPGEAGEREEQREGHHQNQYRNYP